MTDPSDGHDIRGRLAEGKLLQLRRLTTPTVYNGWERITRRDPSRECFNQEECRDFMPELGPMVGYAVTLVIEPGNPEHPRSLENAWSEYRRYVASLPGPKIVVCQDLDQPAVCGSFWGEVNATSHRALGCVGTITDGAVRDLEEMRTVGFKAIAQRLCVGHARAWPVRWGCDVDVFGCRVAPGQLIHADQHGFLAIPAEDESSLLESARLMDVAECETIIAAARTSGLTVGEMLDRLDSASSEFRRRVS